MATDCPHPNGVAAQLEKILSSPSFGNGSQASRLLRFVVERTLEGREEEIKESVLGVEVFLAANPLIPEQILSSGSKRADCGKS